MQRRCNFLKTARRNAAKQFLEGRVKTKQQQFGTHNLPPLLPIQSLAMASLSQEYVLIDGNNGQPLFPVPVDEVMPWHKGCIVHDKDCPLSDESEMILAERLNGISTLSNTMFCPIDAPPPPPDCESPSLLDSDTDDDDVSSAKEYEHETAEGWIPSPEDESQVDSPFTPCSSPVFR